ncbi:MAG: hypothetical protein IH840_09545, partial [Candidatus Heimdallarchaeota archaeon]|nr:hypothetical protein [Candidatus Heimdallarchaeota archaeon]
TDLGNIKLATGHIHRALEYYEKSLPIYLKSGDPWTLGNHYSYIAKANRMLKKFHQALEADLKSLDFYKNLGNLTAIAKSQLAICLTQLHLDPELAYKSYVEARSIVKDQGLEQILDEEIEQVMASVKTLQPPNIANFQ